MKVIVQQQPIDALALHSDCLAISAKVGAVVSFTGLVREFYPPAEQGSAPKAQQEQQSLTLEHYPGMTEKMLQKTLDLACERWNLQHAVIAHRWGKMQLGEVIVFVAACSAHRLDAFQACHFMIDWLKTQAPFWKLEQHGDQATWVQARHSDNEQAQSWQQSLDAQHQSYSENNKQGL